MPDIPKTYEECLQLLAKLELENAFLKTKYDQDISERKKVEELLRESEDRYSDLVENSNDLICTHDLEGNLLSVNKASIKITGYSKEETLKMNLLDIIVPEFRKIFDSYIVKIKTLGEARGLMVIQTKSGERRIWEYNNTLRTEGVSQPIVRGMTKDVTEQKRSELERKVFYEITQGVTSSANLNELLKLIHQSLSKALYADNFLVALHDPQTNLFSFPYFVDKYDPKPEPQKMQRSCAAYVFRKGKPLLIGNKLFQQLIDQNEVELVGLPSPSWIGVPLKSPTRTIGVLVLQHYEKENAYSMHDVQFLDSVGSQIALVIERKLAEEALQKLNLAIHNSQEAVFLTDIEGKITYINPEFTKLYGYTAEEVVGKSTPRILNGGIEDKLYFKSFWESLLNKQGFPTKEYLNKRKDGKLIDIEGSADPIINSNGDIIGFLGIHRDISKRKRAQEEIKKQNEELSLINAEKDKLFSIIAHDLRSPLHGFMALTEIMVDDIGGLPIDKLSEIAHGMSKSAQNLFNLLQNLLEWAQFKKGSLAFAPVEVSLSFMISDCIDQLNHRASQKEITIINNVPENQMVFADVMMTNSILCNFLSNAVKFTSKGGSVIIKADKTDNDMVLISIRDTGVGIQKDIIDKLFKVGEKTGRKGTDGELSTGLGLLLCKDFVTKHGGNIWVESEEGVGSTFYFTLPEKNVLS